MEIPVSVNSFAATATLDTGAEVNCIGQDLLSQIPGSNLFVRPTQRHKGLQLASKQVVPVLECVQIPLQVEKKIIPIEFQVLAQSDLLHLICSSVYPLCRSSKPPLISRTMKS